MGENDAILIYSVGGGDLERKVSVNIISAIDLAKARGAKVYGVVGRDTGYTARMGDIVVVVPQVSPDRVTLLSEAFQAVVWHCLVTWAGASQAGCLSNRDGVIVVPEFRDGRSFAPTGLREFQIYPEGAEHLRYLIRPRARARYPPRAAQTTGGCDFAKSAGF